MDNQNNLNNPIAYCLYARKSSESDERQAMSIDSQIKEMQTLADREKIFIKEIRYESHSAKQSGERPVFKELIADIVLGKFNGILTWHPDRLSRNAGDLGVLVDFMDLGKLKAIKTYSQLFQNTPNDKFLLMILCSQAKLENDNKSVNVKRGIRTKCEMGWRPSPAPLGYMNRAFGGTKDVIIDEARAEIIKEAFEKLVYQNYSGNKIKEFMDKKGFTTKQGKLITISMIYLLLRNPFYYGYFEFPIKSGKWYKGAHQPIITKELYDQAQKELGTFKRAGIPVKDFAFKSIFTCYSCGSSICGEERNRRLTNGRSRKHIYYHCTRGKNKNCRESYISEKGFVKLFVNKIDQLKDEQVIIPERLKEGMSDYKKIAKDTLYFNTDKFDDDIEISNKDYAKYVLMQGSMTAKKDLITTLPIPRRLHNRQLVV